VHHAMMSQGGRPARLSEGFRRLIQEALAKRLDDPLLRRSNDFLNSCLNALEEDLAEVDSTKPIDPRFIRSLLFRRPS